MSLALKGQLSLQLPPVCETEGSNYFTQILLKKDKTIDDAQIIYEKIKGFSSFHDFFAGNLNKLDMSKILSVCQCFKYEKYERGDFIFRQGDPSNDKFYIILSGEVAVMNNQRLGDFGTTQPYSTANKSPQTMTFLTAKDCSTMGKQPISLKNIKEFETKKVLQRLECIGSRENRDGNQPASATQIGKTKAASKMKKVYDAVKALRTMQKCLPGFKKNGPSLTDLDDKEPVGTLNYLDEVEDKEEADRKEFEAMASSHGKIMQYMNVGESFGELALKKNAARSAGILCRTNAEFLVLEKQQFDEVFGKIEKEREEFLKSVFPILSSISSANYNFLVCCFKTERYSKGSYIINEGPKNGQKSKFYIIQSGECVLEKKMPRKVKGIVNMKQKQAPLYDNTQITVASKGSIIGEEVLNEQEQYEYSVKVLSDTVIVQAITKKDFRYRFPQDLQEYVTSLYETKQMHRETMLNALKKDFHTEKDEAKSTNVSSITNSISHLATQSARQCFNRYLARESKIETSNTILKTTISPRGQISSHRESSLPSLREIYNNEGTKDTVPHSFRGPSADRETGPSKSDKPMDRVNKKIGFLHRVPSPPKQTLQDEEAALDAGGFFSQFQNAKDRRTIKIRLANMTNQNLKADKKVGNEHKVTRDSADLIMSKFFSKRDDLDYAHKALLIQAETHETIETTKPTMILTKSLTQSRRSSVKAGTVDLNSLYNQKLLKGRPSIRPLSPTALKNAAENKNKPQSLNEIPSKESLVTSKPDIGHIRRTGTHASWSLQSLKVYPETDKAVFGVKVKSRCDMDEDVGTIQAMNTTEEDREKDIITFKMLEKEKEVLKERTLLANIENMANMTKKSKKSPQASFSGVNKVNSVKGENTMYTQLNEAKEWRMKVFRKPQRRLATINSARALSENTKSSAEGKKPVEVCGQDSEL